MIISYYVLNRSDNEGLFVFQSLHEDTMLKEFYNRIKNKQIETNLYFLSDSILPFISNPKILNLLQTKDLKSLPIIVIDEEIVKYGAYLSVEELEKLTNIGMSIQEDNGVHGT
ncbi:arsenic metallochaperone ArsD family protein [Enterococcus faecium]|uniref:arsenic metallochaperone ArsD family protein n=1 Tax=Enterococcus faecium TaxID=1352 RepID=UPI0019EA015E|nr:arsenic metallochaperone ArsD family protein [Enterococcus faecium]EGP5213232.1 arsenical resistance operon transcriptional repressor ArsD [Enterococcus faecium]MDN3079247.1 arsenic metallochaperone ArsD family protein [Enterococcus faecium]MDQ8233145.1 arsenic metallochaperone ArsD family protein [Enterococcus faecium]MDQ8240479.1 arsenic metallochaperone ArsD family protein [Enterococcus faecium]